MFLLNVLSCSFKNVNEIHGVNNLQVKSSNLKINESNKNDVIRILGPTILIDKNNKNIWQYIEVRHSKNKLGKKIIIRNNLLIIKFNQYGIVENKIFLDQKDMKNLDFDEDITKGIAVKDTFLKRVLNSTRKRFLNKTKSN